MWSADWQSNTQRVASWAPTNANRTEMMENIPYYDSNNIKSCLKYDSLVEAIEKALGDFSQGANGGVSQPLRATVDVADQNG